MWGRCLKERTCLGGEGGMWGRVAAVSGTGLPRCLSDFNSDPHSWLTV